MYSNNNEIEKIKKQILLKYSPEDIILFGSHAKGLVKRGSDIVIYTPTEWSKYKDDRANFANIIKRTGVSLV
jgi:predicted nucleotidyltransferase